MPYPYYMPIQQNYGQQPQIQPQMQQTPIQNGGFMLVPSEDIVNSYPVAPGNCVTFKIEGKPIVMEKSMGFSQLEAPKIEKYRLVKEEPIIAQEEPIKEETDKSSYALKTDLEPIFDSIKALKEDIKSLQEIPDKKKKKEVKDDE